MKKEPDLLVEYCDPVYGATGWLVIDDLSRPLAAGGLRVQQGLTKEHVIKMAQNMTKKMRVCNLNVSGAKSGINFDPLSQNKNDVIINFMKAILPYLQNKYSMGSDLNTNMMYLEKNANSLGLISVKGAIHKAQGLLEDDFAWRLSLLDQPVIGDWKLGQIRAGYAVAASALKTLDFMGIEYSKAKVIVQGFGVLAKAAILGLLEENIKVVGVADKDISIYNQEGLPVDKWLNSEGTLLPKKEIEVDYKLDESEDILYQQSDLMIVAALEDTIHENNYQKMRTKAIVQGANLAVVDKVKPLLHKNNIFVIPCFVSGAGGPISMNGLFGKKDIKDGKDVLKYIKSKTKEITGHILSKGKEENLNPEEAALDIINRYSKDTGEKPYKVEEE